MCVTDQEWNEIFKVDDEEEFVRIVRTNLANGAHLLHQIAAEEYVRRCRNEWAACETDEVYSAKLLIDRKLLDSKPSPFERLTGDLDRVDLYDEPDEDPYCIAMGLIRPDGSLVGAPPDYDKRRTRPKGRHGLAVALESDFPYEEPEEPQVASHLICLFDVLGFSDRLEQDGIGAVKALYDRLIEVALKPHAANKLWTPFLQPLGDRSFCPGIFWLPLRYAYFSDTILLWVPCHPECLGPFLDRCLNVFCEALKLGIPLRGAISAGDLILHKKANYYLGLPLVEAVKLEKAQNWLGVVLGVSVRSERLQLPFSPLQVILRDAPVKAGNRDLLSGLALDWPRRWRELYSGQSAQLKIEAIRAPEFGQYYDNAIEFVRYSDANPNWFMDARHRQAK